MALTEKEKNAAIVYNDNDPLICDPATVACEWNVCYAVQLFGLLN